MDEGGGKIENCSTNFWINLSSEFVHSNFEDTIPPCIYWKITTDVQPVRSNLSCASTISRAFWWWKKKKKRAEKSAKASKDVTTSDCKKGHICELKKKENMTLFSQGDYMRVIQEVQFRRHSRVRDFDLYDFLEAFEEVTLKICGVSEAFVTTLWIVKFQRKFSSHRGIIRTMTHLRKDRFERMDPRYNDDVRPCFTDESDSDFENLQMCVYLLGDLRTSPIVI